MRRALPAGAAEIVSDGVPGSILVRLDLMRDAGACCHARPAEDAAIADENELRLPVL